MAPGVGVGSRHVVELTPVLWAIRAKRDIAGHYRYLAQFNASTAQSAMAGFYEVADLLERYPLAGKAVSAGRREFVRAQYVIVYKAGRSAVRTLRVGHGAQNRPP